MSAYVSATFEKDLLTVSGLARIIVTPRGDGIVPPVPTPTYFPTSPDSLSEFIVSEYVSDAIGERWSRVAVLADYTGVPLSLLTTFEDMATDFQVAGVVPGDVLVVTLSDSQLWLSDAYAASPFTFQVVAVPFPQQITISPPLPAFGANLSWSIPARVLVGTAGVTRRSISPLGGGGGPTEFRDVRFNNYFAEAVAAENFVSAVKAGLTQLANETTGVSFIDESFTGIPA